MELYIINKARTPVAVIDKYTSLIWTTRYYTHGDFELYIPANKDLLDYLKSGYYVIRDDSEVVMIIEKIEIKTNVETGDFFIISGRSAESILAQRIIWTQTVFQNYDAASAITKLISDVQNNSKRAFPNFRIDDPQLSGIYITAQFTGDNLLEAISTICMRFGWGIKIVLENGQLVFKRYEGSDNRVTFSQEFDNLISSDYSSDYTNFANTALVAGEGEGALRKRKTVWSTSSEPNGMSRKEIFVDARDMSTNDGEISTADYYEQLAERGLEKLTEHEITQVFESEVEPSFTYKYKEDYNIGDLVTIINDYGVGEKSRIVEIIESWDAEGYKVVPTLEEWSE